MNRIILKLALGCLLTFAAQTRAELQPGEVAILVNQNSNAAAPLAGYYAKQRGIPESQICAVPIPMGETLDRATWVSSVRPAIKSWLAQNNLAGKVKCFVTTWDVPLKIDKRLDSDPVTQKRKMLLEKERQRRIERLISFIGRFDAIAPSGPVTPTDDLDSSASLKDVGALLQQRLRAAENRVKAIADPNEKQQAVRTLTQLSIGTAGLQVVTQNLQRTVQAGSGNERINRELHFGQGRLTGLGEGQTLLDGIPPSVERDTNLIALIERGSGIAGTITWIDAQLASLAKNETYSSFDSELSLVLEDEYPLLRWLPNYLHYNYDGSPLRDVTKTLMVSRLEAPTLPLLKSLIDNAIQVEKTGLTGKVYLDAKGLTTLDDQRPVPRGSDADYDRSLLLADKLLRENTQLEVTLNNEDTLFAEGSCPDSALYCGWYSLAKYVDAFQWKPGAVGYHMASSEATTLRNPESKVWCKQMLERGVGGTIGPVYEPYLLAFPRPNEFLALLCSGRYTFIECIYRTKSTNSWVMTTVGDPLYNPFKANPALKEPPEEYARLFGIQPN